jgi:dolichol-phosphate mannosyltransferase
MTSEIAVIVPLFNEAANVAPLSEEIRVTLERTGRPWELVLVDDASTDETWANILSQQSRDPRIRGVRHRRNLGQSAAVWTGITQSEAPILCTLDGDLQNDPAELPGMIRMLDELDFVSGHRVNRKDTLVRKLSSRIARAARKAVLGYDFADTGCALRAFKRSSLTGVFPFNGLHRFLPIIVAGNGSRCREIPVNHRPRVAGVSKYGVWNRLGRGILDLFAIAWYQKRRLNIGAVERS